MRPSDPSITIEGESAEIGTAKTEAAKTNADKQAELAAARQRAESATTAAEGLRKQSAQRDSGVLERLRKAIGLGGVEKTSEEQAREDNIYKGVMKDLLDNGVTDAPFVVQAMRGMGMEALPMPGTEEYGKLMDAVKVEKRKVQPKTEAEKAELTRMQRQLSEQQAAEAVQPTAEAMVRERMAGAAPVVIETVQPTVTEVPRKKPQITDEQMEYFQDMVGVRQAAEAGGGYMGSDKTKEKGPGLGKLPKQVPVIEAGEFEQARQSEQSEPTSTEETFSADTTLEQMAQAEALRKADVFLNKMKQERDRRKAAGTLPKPRSTTRGG